MSNNDFFSSWERVLNPTKLKEKIISFSIYVTAFELLKNVIIDKTQFFFTGPFDDESCNADYEKKVLSKSKSKLYASLLWLQAMEAIDANDIELFNELKGTRNKIAHEMYELLLTRDVENINIKLSDMLKLLNKIELWWFENLDMAIDPEAYPENFDINSVQPMSVWTLELILKISIGDEREAFQQYEEFCKVFKP
ncbi:hypothetical protein [Franconibacter helveticus]|uniref:hypothetical protein n=1 Tax=Franconibacter helveticus TaxID=357240 RepID=UPI0004981094|nr:hypothetical protein [Franconibacter helveticus]